ncbi:MAG TPA: exodeoxyribonuclease VII large subunit [Vicinamibacterales bacterium]|jgi:exodeoxyribonuclease VII large subunit|nr:exodeoxyribonuclease VII large subunit [Vicinamibacterales bacterium]
MSSPFDLPFEDEPGASSNAGATDEPSVHERRRAIFTVSELTAGIRDLLETAYVDVRVEGEISNCRLWNTGHLYFTLKDPGSQLKAVMFKSAVRSLKFKPEDGLHVVARGRLSVYDPKGEYQIVCEHIEPHGLGALQLAFDQLKRRLHAEGLFDVARKRPLPALPRKIGVVTSLDGAAIRDIIKVLDRRYPNVHLVIRPTRVQGEGAAADVARGLAAIVKVPGIDVVIVGRGGGSIEDLWAFNEEVVARAIAASPVPVISAVGHESDVTIADFAADVRAPTPSAAAEIVVTRKEDFFRHIERLGDRVHGSVRGLIARLESRVHQLNRRPAFAGYGARLAMRGRHSAETMHALRHAARAALVRRTRTYQALRLQLEQFDLRRRLGAIRARLVGAEAALRAAVIEREHRARGQLQTCAARLESLSPLGVLGRGYAVCWNETRTTVIRKASEVRPKDRVRVTLSEGELECDVVKSQK